MTREFTRTDIRGEAWREGVPLIEREIIGLLIDSILSNPCLLVGVADEEGEQVVAPTRDRKLIVPEIGITGQTWLRVEESMALIHTPERMWVEPMMQFFASNADSLEPENIAEIVKAATPMTMGGGAETVWTIHAKASRRIGSFMLVHGNEWDVLCDWPWKPGIEESQEIMDQIAAPIGDYTGLGGWL